MQPCQVLRHFKVLPFVMLLVQYNLGVSIGADQGNYPQMESMEHSADKGNGER
jgi:hypothetical protein